MPQSSNHKSRRKTPWDNSMERTASQQFLYDAYGGMYQQRHPVLLETGEDALINSYVPGVCPHCQSEHIKRFGQTGNHIQRYRCLDCEKTFTPVTCTIFEGHKISIREWITLPNSLTTIGANPFPCNKKLNDIRIPSDHPIFYMQDRALFSRPDKRIICYLYSEDTPDAVYDIPVGTEIIGDEAFYMNFVAGITIPNTVVRIGNDAFTGCDFENIVIPDSVTNIGDLAFSFTGCESVSIPGSVTDIGANPFAQCDRLTKIEIAKNHPYLGMKDGVLFSKPDRRLVSYPCGVEVEEYRVPEGVEIIGDYAFYECEIDSVILPDTVTTIGKEAFGGGCGPKRVTVPQSVINIGQDAFEHGNLPDEDYDCTVILDTGSFAEAYCQENNVSYCDEKGNFHQREAIELD